MSIILHIGNDHRLEDPFDSYSNDDDELSSQQSDTEGKSVIMYVLSRLNTCKV